MSNKKSNNRNKKSEVGYHIPMSLTGIPSEKIHISGGQLKRGGYKQDFDPEKMMQELNPDYREQTRKKGENNE